MTVLNTKKLKVGPIKKFSIIKKRAWINKHFKQNKNEAWTHKKIK